jgi:hypothetical protein
VVTVLTERLASGMSGAYGSIERSVKGWSAHNRASAERFAADAGKTFGGSNAAVDARSRFRPDARV